MDDSIEQLTGGYTMIVDGKDYVVEGYAEVNGQNRMIYKSGSFYYYYSDNQKMEMIGGEVSPTTGSTIKVDGIDCTYKLVNFFGEKNDKTIAISDTDKELMAAQKTHTCTVETPEFDGVKMKVGSDVTIDNKQYYVGGYVDIGNGERITLYHVKHDQAYYESWHKNDDEEFFYLDKNGIWQKAKLNFWDNSKIKINGKEYAVLGTVGEKFDLGNSDKELFKEYSVPETTPTTEVSGINYPNDSRYRNINEEYPLQVNLINRKRYYVIYKYEATTDTFVNNSYGPLNAQEGRQVAYETFNMVPGQGKGARESAISFEKLIGNIKYALEDVIELSNQAVIFPKQTPNNPGGAKAQNILDYVDTMTPSIYKNFAKVMPAVVELANTTQKSKNNARYNDAVSEKNRLKSIYSYNTDSTMSIKAEEIREDVVSKYKGFLTGYEYTQSSVSMISSLPRENAKLEEYGDLHISFLNTAAIIDDLEIIIRNFIIEAEKIIEVQMNKIKAVNGFTPSLATRLSFTNIEEPLTELREKIKELLYMYRGWLEEAKKIKKGGNSTPTPPSPNGGYTGGYTPTPTPTPTTSAPTTEVPTDTRPTDPPVVQPRIDDKTDNGGNSNGGGSNGGGTPINGNSHGGDYSPYGGYSGSSSETSSTATSTEVPKEAADVIKEGNSYTLPTSSKPVQPTTPTTSKGNSAIPVLAGLAAAAAAGIGAKAYIDRKKNRNNDESSEEFKAEDWSGNNEINIEYQEPKTNEAETLDDDYDFEEPEKYGARSNQELENLQ